MYGSVLYGRRKMKKLEACSIINNKNSNINELALHVISYTRDAISWLILPNCISDGELILEFGTYALLVVYLFRIRQLVRLLSDLIL